MQSNSQQHRSKFIIIYPNYLPSSKLDHSHFTADLGFLVSYIFPGSPVVLVCGLQLTLLFPSSGAVYE